MKVCDHEIRIQGKIVKIARLEGDLYHFIDDPEPILHALRENKVKADLFTFMQRLPDSAVKFKYTMEWQQFPFPRLTNGELSRLPAKPATGRGKQRKKV